MLEIKTDLGDRFQELEREKTEVQDQVQELTLKREQDQVLFQTGKDQLSAALQAEKVSIWSATYRSLSLLKISGGGKTNFSHLWYLDSVHMASSKMAVLEILSFLEVLEYMGQNFERCTIGSRHGVKLKFQKC